MPADAALQAPPSDDVALQAQGAGRSRRSWWPACKRALVAAFLLAVAVLLVRMAQQVHWGQALDALRALPAATLLGAAALAFGSHALYATYDLIGRSQTGHGLSRWRVLGVTFVSYAFNLNLGTLVGGVALRYRLYSQLGLRPEVITRVVATSMLTNWIGYLLLAGVVLVLRPPQLPAAWAVGSAWLTVLGALLLATVAAYVAACWRFAGRQWQLRGHGVQLPSGRVALLQLAISSLNWMLIAATCWTLLAQRLPYADVLSTLLVAAVAGVMTHVPGGLGVLEATFVALLAPPLAQAEVLGALLAYRALYYLAPLALAGALYFFVERAPQSVSTTPARPVHSAR